MIYKEYKNESFNLYTVKTNKFKTCYMEIIFYKELDEKNITIENVLSSMIVESCKKYNKRKYVVEHLEDLYNAKLFPINSRVGNLRTISFEYNFIDPIYAEKSYFKDVITFPFEMIFRPNIVNGEFDERTLKIVKNRVLANIKSQKESPTSYAIKRAMIKTDKDSKIAKELVGNIKDLNKVNSSNLVEFYKYMLDNYHCDIYIVGNIEMEKANIYINEVFENNIIKTSKESVYTNIKQIKKPLVLEEKDEFEQATLVCTYDLNNLSEKEKNYTMYIFNTIFGNGTMSNKLMQNVREKNSLCYTISSIYQKYDNLLIIYAGIDSKNANKAIKMVNKSLKEMINGKFSEEEIKNAINFNVNGLKSALDNPASISDNYFLKNMVNIPLINEKIDKMDDVSKKDIVSVSKKIKLVSTYLMREGKSK